jgi:signal transduction histidine kinase
LVVESATRSFVSHDTPHETPPETQGEEEPTSPTTLPDTWSYREREHYRSARYRTEFDLEAVPSMPFSVYIARADTNASVWLNGEPLGGAGRFSKPSSRLRHMPLLLSVEPSLLRRGINHVEVQLFVEPTSAGTLSRIELGPTPHLARKHALRYFLQITWIQIAACLAGVLIVVVTTVYGPRGRGTSYRWFQLSVALWIVYASEIWIVDAPIPAQYWEAVANGAQYLSIWAIMLGFHRALEGPRRRIEAGVLVVIACTIALLAVVPPHLLWLARAAIGVGICALAGYTVEFVRGSKAAQEWVLEKHHVAAGALGVVAGFHDIASAPFGWPISGYWLVQHAGALAILFTLAAIFRHLIASIRATSSLGRDLEVRFDTAERILAERFARIRTIENAYMIEAERARLTRGLHEGVGSVLMSTIAGVEAEHPSASPGASVVADRIRDALDDLRLVIDSLRPEESLLDMLARLRSRLAARFERRGIAVAWQVDDVPAMRGFEAEHALVLLRILQDAFRGSERVAGVRTVTVRTGSESRDDRAGIYVEIEDDGRETIARPEHAAMRDRAAALGGVVSVSRETAATRTRLWLPVDLPEVSRT